MVQVRCEYYNVPDKRNNDYFIYTNIEVTGHADALNMSHTTGIKLCAGVSACCYGIRHLVSNDYNLEIESGHFKVWTDKKKDLKNALSKESVYALNTLVCQLFELYKEYPNSFTMFDIVEKEKN